MKDELLRQANGSKNTTRCRSGWEGSSKWSARKRLSSHNASSLSKTSSMGSFKKTASMKHAFANSIMMPRNWLIDYERLTWMRKSSVRAISNFGTPCHHSSNSSNPNATPSSLMRYNASRTSSIAPKRSARLFFINKLTLWTGILICRSNRSEKKILNWPWLSERSIKLWLTS